MKPVALIDAENVRRSTWPNISRGDLVALVRAWVDTTDGRALLAFDGAAPATESDDERLEIVGSGRESADDVIARTAKELVHGGRRYQLVTSDRGLRDRAGQDADDVVGGGTFCRILRATSDPSAPSSRAAHAGPA